MSEFDFALFFVRSQHLTPSAYKFTKFHVVSEINFISFLTHFSHTPSFVGQTHLPHRPPYSNLPSKETHTPPVIAPDKKQEAAPKKFGTASVTIFSAIGTAWIYYSNAVTMPMNDSASSEAPPIRPPSTLGFAKRALAFEGLQLPP